MLVPDSATPLYLQLEEILRQEILSGTSILFFLQKRATSSPPRMNWWSNTR